MKRQTDRGIAIIAASILQDHLVLAIKTELLGDPKSSNKLFGEDGKLNDFEGMAQGLRRLPAVPGDVLRRLGCVGFVRRQKLEQRSR